MSVLTHFGGHSKWTSLSQGMDLLPYLEAVAGVRAGKSAGAGAGAGADAGAPRISGKQVHGRRSLRTNIVCCTCRLLPGERKNNPVT